MHQLFAQRVVVVVIGNDGECNVVILLLLVGVVVDDNADVTAFAAALSSESFSFQILTDDVDERCETEKKFL